MCIRDRVGEAINPGSYHYWHTTGVVGALCSAVAAGKLMGLDRKKLLHAIGSAGTQAAGLWQFLEDGAMSKTLHTANGTLCGLRSARLAALGFTAAEDILAGDRGLLGAMTPDNHPEALTRALSWENCALLTNSLKPYACCRHTHAADYCAQLLRGEHRLEPVSYTHLVSVPPEEPPPPSPASLLQEAIPISIPTASNRHISFDSFFITISPFLFLSNGIHPGENVTW